MCVCCEHISDINTESFISVRQVKLAYVDSFAKPPRDVARRQAKHGTALPASHPVKTGPPSKSSPRPTAPAINAAASTSNAAANNANRGGGSSTGPAPFKSNLALGLIYMHLVVLSV